MRIITLFFFLTAFLYPVNAPSEEITFRQQDGTTFKGHLKGDEHFNWIELENGEVATYNHANKYFEHATLGKNSKGEMDLLPSGKKVTRESSKIKISKSTKIDRKLLRKIWAKRYRLNKNLEKSKFGKISKP